MSGARRFSGGHGSVARRSAHVSGLTEMLRSSGSRSGWVMVDLMVAVLLGGLLLGPLVGAALAVISEANGMLQDNNELVKCDAEMGAWGYGPSVTSGLWRPGPELQIAVGQTRPVLLGLWIEGWFKGEWEVAPGQELVLPMALWVGATGKETVIRMRRPETCWGPPWRSLVADSSGVVNCSHLDLPSSLDAGRVAAHAPFFGYVPFVDSWSGESVAPVFTGPLPALIPVPSGSVSMSLSGESQSWSMLPGRDLDVYY